MKKIITTIILFASILAHAQDSKMNPKEMKEYMKKSALRTNPDYVCYVPGSYDGSTEDSDNEHFLVFDGPDGSLMTIWTQHQGSWAAMRSHIVFSRSTDKGVTWSTPRHIAGPNQKGDKTLPAVWAFPMVSKSGRIYVLWNQNQGIEGWNYLHCGTMSGMYSDDNGKTWTTPQDIPMPKSIYNDPEGKIPGEWIVWQKPERAPDGKYTIGYTHWVNRAVAFYNGKDRLPPLLAGTGMSWVWWESVVEFMKFENLDKNPEPKDLKISYLSCDENALRVPNYMEPRLSIAQEPSIVTLPDKRLFCTMRTGSGYIWYTLSSDNGKTWCNPRPLLRRDHGSPILQPLGCCPVYKLADGRYVLLHHNNRGGISDPSNIWGPRTPAYLALGEFRSGADQPIWFSESKVFLDNKSLNSAGEFQKGCYDLASYTSFTNTKGKNILWYPDAKCWLLGKEVTEKFLNDLKVP